MKWRACSEMSMSSPLASLASICDAGSGETTDQLLARFRAPICATMVDEDGRADVLVAASNEGATVNVRQLTAMTVGDLTISIPIPPNGRTLSGHGLPDVAETQRFPAVDKRQS
jgi:hypothetical protein